MIKMIRTSGDGFYEGCEAKMDRIYTVQEFIEEILSIYSNERGYFSIEGRAVDFRDGKLIGSIPIEYALAPVARVKSGGAYGNVNYFIDIAYKEEDLARKQKAGWVVKDPSDLRFGENNKADLKESMNELTDALKRLIAEFENNTALKIESIELKRTGESDFNAHITMNV